MFTVGDKIKNVHTKNVSTITKVEFEYICDKEVYETDEKDYKGGFIRFNSDYANNYKMVNGNQ